MFCSNTLAISWSWVLSLSNPNSKVGDTPGDYLGVESNGSKATNIITLKLWNMSKAKDQTETAA
jgi:hypothetical protein